MTTAWRGVDRGGLGVAAVLLLAPFVALSPAFIFRAQLSGDHVFARMAELVHSARALLEGEVLWTPHFWMGHPLLGVPAFATLYPPKVLLLIGNPATAYATYLVLHILLAELGVYFYLTTLGRGRLGALFGALAYGCAGFMLDHREHNPLVVAGAWVPFVLFLFERAATRGTPWAYLGAALAFAMVPFSGSIEVTAYLSATVLVLASARSLFERHPRWLLAAALALGPALLVAALELAPYSEFASELASGARQEYELIGTPNVLLLAATYLPLPPGTTQMYFRAGLLVVCATAVAVASFRLAPVLLRSWMVVAAIAFSIVLARRFPPLAQVLHELPLVGGRQGALCDQLVVVLALSVLGAWGFDRALSAGGGATKTWLLIGAAVGALSWLALWIAGNTGARLNDARLVWAQASWLTALGAVAAFLLWVFALEHRLRSRALWAAVAVGPLLEASLAMHANAEPRRDHAAALGAPRSDVARVLANSPMGDATLVGRDVHSLLGPRPADPAAREVLGMDESEPVTSYEDLAFSTLPSVFGVSHVVLPSMVCGSGEFSLANEGALCARFTGSMSPVARSVASRTAACTALLTDATARYRLQADSRADAVEADAAGLALSYWGRSRHYPDFALYIGGATLGPEFRRYVRDVSLLDAWPAGKLGFYNDTRKTVALRHAGLYVERENTIGALGSHTEMANVGSGAKILPNLVRLTPADGEAKIERRLRWPRASRPAGGAAVLAVEARAPLPLHGKLFVDVHAGPEFDPNDAELVVVDSQLGSEWRVFRRLIQIDAAPDEFWLRAFAASDRSIELREARIAARTDGPVYAYPEASVAASVHVDEPMRLPLRAFEIVLDAEAPVPPQPPVTFGLELATSSRTTIAWQVAPAELTSRRRIRGVALVPPDLRQASLFVRVEGRSPLALHGLSLSDACGRRGYRSPQPLGEGFFLFENPARLPRAYAVGETIQAASIAEARRTLLDFSPADLANKAVVSAPMPRGLRAGVVQGMNIESRAAHITVRSDAGPTLLVMNDRYDRNWRATIDGDPAPILRVNALVRGVIVPAGTHRVSFSYVVPRGVWIGMGLALAGVLVALLVAPALHARWLGAS